PRPVARAQPGGRRPADPKSVFGQRQPVTAAAHRLDEPRGGRVALDLVAQASDVDREVVAFGPVLRAPHLREQRLVRDSLAGSVRKLDEQVEFGRRAPELRVPAVGLARGEIEALGAWVDRSWAAILRTAS